jgi:hypothetical protein
VAQLASVLAWGASGHQFESGHPDFASRNPTIEGRWWASLFIYIKSFNKYFGVGPNYIVEEQLFNFKNEPISILKASFSGQKTTG